LIFNEIEMNKILRILFVVFLILFCFDGYSGNDGSKERASRKKSIPLMPDYLKLQYAGNIGLGSVGIGYFWWKDKMQTEIFYGKVPSWAGGNTIRTVALKNMANIYDFHPASNIVIKEQIGFSTNLAFTKKTYMDLPDYYPDNYYSPNAIHIMPFLSQECTIYFKRYCFVKKIGFYSECNAMDTYLYQSLKSKEVNFMDVFSLALGLVIAF